MGEDAVNDGEQKLPGHLSHLFWSTFRDHMVQEYQLPNSDDFDDLEECLTGIAMRDQQRTHPNFTLPNQQRKAVHRAAKALVEEAHKALAAIHTLRLVHQQFHAAAYDDHLSAVMLAEVFDIDYVAPTALEPPPVLDVWPAAGLVDTEIGCFHLSEVHNAKKEVQPRVQA